MSGALGRMLPALVLLAPACGGAPVPSDRVAVAEAEIRAAQVLVDDLKAEQELEDVPKVELHLKKARDQVGEAKALIEDKENERADLVLQRAEIDAKLAQELAKEAASKAEVRDAKERLSELQGGTSEGTPQNPKE